MKPAAASPTRPAKPASPARAANPGRPAMPLIPDSVPPDFAILPGSADSGAAAKHHTRRFYIIFVWLATLLRIQSLICDRLDCSGLHSSQSGQTRVGVIKS